MIDYPLGVHGIWRDGPKEHETRNTKEDPPLNNWESNHALDIIVPQGTPVYAVADGTIRPGFGVSESKNPKLEGLRFHLNTGDNNYYYAHLSQFAPNIDIGSKVHRGDLLGYSGVADGVPHLHFAVRDGDATEILRNAREHTEQENVLKSSDTNPPDAGVPDGIEPSYDSNLPMGVLSDAGQASEANPPDMGAPKEGIQQEGGRPQDGNQHYDANPPMDIPSELNQSVAPPELNQNIAPPEVNQSVQPPELNQSFAPPELNQSVAPPELNQSIQPPELNQSIAPPELNQNIAPPEVNQSVQSPELNQSFAPPDSGYDAGSSNAGGYNSGNSDIGGYDGGYSDAGGYDAGSSDAGGASEGDAEAASRPG